MAEALRARATGAFGPVGGVQPGAATGVCGAPAPVAPGAVEHEGRAGSPAARAADAADDSGGQAADASGGRAGDAGGASPEGGLVDPTLPTGALAFAPDGAASGADRHPVDPAPCAPEAFPLRAEGTAAAPSFPVLEPSRADALPLGGAGGESALPLALLEGEADASGLAGIDPAARAPSAGQGAAGGDGNANTVSLGGGDDAWRGRGGNDTAHGGGGADLIHGGKGRDALYGDGGGDSLYGDGGRDTLHGGRGADLLNGGAGDDLLYGEAGRDRFVGGGGEDVFFGGGGRDVFGLVRDGTSNTILIVDFEPGVDRCRIEGIDGPVRRSDFAVLDLTDGTSNTLLFGEAIGRFDTERGSAPGFDDLFFV
ncbi:hypothetical protein [uncultured Albimonas sp.]|uniref:hypothetical protein n=1 Tax=uncultured Albimonas sp. TaxID=1331701 RepID=UPI0030EEACA3